MRTSSRGPGRHSTAQEGASWKCTWSVALTVHICIIYASTSRYVIKGPMAISILFLCSISHWSSCTISKALPGTPKRNTLGTHIKNTGNYFRGGIFGYLIRRAGIKFRPQEAGPPFLCLLCPCYESWRVKW